MKKIAFFVQWMLCGGVENALIALSNKLFENGNDVTIYVIDEKGEFIKKIPHNVQLRKIPMPEKVRKSIPVGGTKVTVRECLKEKHYLQAVGFVVRHKLSRNQFAELNVDFNQIPYLDEKYDIAVNFHMHSPFLVRYLSERVSADKKLTWIHNDFETTQYDIKSLDAYLKCVDGFYGVSNKLVNEFVERLPQYKDKTQVALNIVPAEEIKQKADEYYPEEFTAGGNEKLKILTVGRLEEQKGYDIALDVCEKLIDSGAPIEWFVLGDGTQRSWIESEIQKRKLVGKMHLLGVRMNPYPYFKNCDIYVQTSKHEGWGITITEAKILQKPIVTTDFAGAREQIVDEVSGDIADINDDSVFKKLERLIKEDERRISYSDELSKEVNSEEPEWISVFE
jgi:glycosyltransferase involved in cell wall biosynthesis